LVEDHRPWAVCVTRGQDVKTIDWQFGFWLVMVSTMQTELQCPQCEKIFNGNYSYCPHCGEAVDLSATLPDVEHPSVTAEDQTEPPDLADIIVAAQAPVPELPKADVQRPDQAGMQAPRKPPPVLAPSMKSDQTYPENTLNKGRSFGFAALMIGAAVLALFIAAWVIFFVW
jgi:hypothetical protein